eukprot:CAMPEP_0178500374 /NCGR_PEP_ID=MMETSP0696-20121128/16349_1 /TAXON_ID=265572 /ORGANISM="Extubocellulus spinifer, Strain CCMP396" /LENGTH=636 /DNA_ID=CAMNT_0020129185 /DNA_START=561 /DNA_END=2471 /DNA_ORIENTATION=+
MRLRIISINDVYKLDNFPSFKTLVNYYSSNENVQGENSNLLVGNDDDAVPCVPTPPDHTLVLFAGDFLGPSLLSSLDSGRGMVDTMSACGVSHVCFGNHECDVPISALPDRIRESKFTWINTNMRQLDDIIGVKTCPYDVVTICKDGVTKNIALLGLLTEDASLYRPGAFGDAKIERIVDCSERVLGELEKNVPDHIDLVVPMTHQSMPNDRNFAKHFTGETFPLVIGGHDHDIYDERLSGCRIIKTGMDAANAAIIDIDWSLDPGASKRPDLSIKLVPTASFPPDPEIQRLVEFHERILRGLEQAKLFKLHHDGDAAVEPIEVFTTFKNRLRPTNGSTVLVTAIRRGMRCQCAILNAGSIRGNKDYREEWFCWSDLKEEIPFSTEMAAVAMPGETLSDAIAYSRKGACSTPPIETGGYLQCCDMIVWNESTQSIQSIRGEAFDPDATYLVALPAKSLAGMDMNVPLVEWAASNDVAIDPEACRPAKLAIVEFFSSLLWLELGSFADIDEDKSGCLSEEEIRRQAEKVFGRNFADLVLSNVMSVADINKDGKINPVEMLVTRFVATDMMSHVYSSDELPTMIRLASEVLDLPPSHPEVAKIVAKLKEKIDTRKNGRMTREEAIEALGTLNAKDILV